MFVEVVKAPDAFGFGLDRLLRSLSADFELLDGLLVADWIGGADQVLKRGNGFCVGYGQEEREFDLRQDPHQRGTFEWHLFGWRAAEWRR